jgi:hypothetical protein
MAARSPVEATGYVAAAVSMAAAVVSMAIVEFMPVATTIVMATPKIEPEARSPIWVVIGVSIWVWIACVINP